MTRITRNAVGLLMVTLATTAPLAASAQQQSAAPTPITAVMPAPIQVATPIPDQMPPVATISGNRWTEDFDSGVLDGWELIPGAGFAQGASGIMLAPQCPAKGLWAAVRPDNFLLEFDFLQGTGAAEVVLSLFELPTGPGGHYVVAFAEGIEIGLLREPPGQIQYSYVAPLQMSPGTWYRVSVQVVGGSFQVSVDGTKVLSAVDPQPHGGGIIGFGCHHGSGFGYDNISITSPELPPQPPPSAQAIPINIPGAVAPPSSTTPGPPTNQPPQYPGSGGSRQQPQASGDQVPSWPTGDTPRNRSSGQQTWQTTPTSTTGPSGGPSPSGQPRRPSKRMSPSASICTRPGYPTVMDLGVRSAAPASEPLPRSPFTDPVFATCVVRATDRRSDISSGDSSAGLTPEYARVQAFNADDSRLIIRGTEGSWYLYDAATLKPLAELSIGDEPRWHPTDPGRLFFVDDTRLMTHDIRTGASQLMYDFSAELPGQRLERVSTRYEGRFSYDGRYWGAMAQDQTWDPVGFIVYDLAQGRTTARRDIRGLPGVADGIDYVTISPLGNYFLAGFDRLCARGQLGTDQRPCGLMVYDRNLGFGRGLLRFASHHDLVLDRQGRELAVFQDIDTDNISTVDLATGQVVDLWPIDFSHTAIGLHFSGCASAVPGWALVSTHDEDLGSHTWLDDQVFAMELSPGGRVVRLAHTHSVTVEGAAGAYWAEPHATVNRDFTRILFGTNWGRVGTDEVETFLIELPPGWMQQLPTLGASTAFSGGAS
jgi:hypothetical protein